MPLLSWATDLHFEFTTVDAVVAFCEQVIAQAPAGLLLTGDIAQAPSIERYLRALDQAIPMPIYFVLGNHDFYHGSFADVHATVDAVVRHSRHLVWMSRVDAVTIDAQTALVGHDGWADSRCGDYAASRVMLNDYRLIRELTGLTADARRLALETLGDAAAAHLARVLPLALAHHRRVIVLTHVPPFPEASWYRGRISDPDWLPHFCAKAVGDVLVEVATAHPEQEVLVLCGHTHAGGTIVIRPNLSVTVGFAEYGRPALQDPLELRSTVDPQA